MIEKGKYKEAILDYLNNPKPESIRMPNFQEEGIRGYDHLWVLGTSLIFDIQGKMNLRNVMIDREFSNAMEELIKEGLVLRSRKPTRDTPHTWKGQPLPHYAIANPKLSKSF
jgi:hypothetical protein